MRLSAKVDLTEHSDFGGSSLVDFRLNHTLLNEIGVTYESENMSCDEYDKIMLYEHTFGRKRHFSQASQIFRPDEGSFIHDMEGHCQRCGKKLRIPWKKFYGLCKECHEVVDENKIPWHPKYGEERVRDNAMDIFNMR